MIRKFDGEWNYNGYTIRFRDAPLVEIFQRYYIYENGNEVLQLELMGHHTTSNQQEVEFSIDSLVRIKEKNKRKKHP